MVNRLVLGLLAPAFLALAQYTPPPAGAPVSVTAGTPDVVVTPSPGTGTFTLSTNPGYHFANFYPQFSKVFNSTANAKICAVGDSTTFGVGSTGVTSAGQNFPPLSYPGQLTTFLTSNMGIKAHSNSFIGSGLGAASTYANSDSRITVGSSWAPSATYISLGLDTFTASTSTNALSFIPTTNIDTFKIYYIINSANGVLSYQIGAGTPSTVNTATGTNNSIGSVTITGTLGSNTLNLKWSSGGAVYVVGAEGWDSSQSWISVLNMGATGSSSVNWNVGSTNAYSPANSASYAAIGCNLTIFDLVINDYDLATGVSTFTANMTALVAAAQGANSDVIVMTGVPTNPSGEASVATQLLYTQALRGVAIAAGVPLVDLALRWQSYANAVTWNVYADAVTHPNATGYADNANAVLSVIRPTGFESSPFVTQVVPSNMTYSSANQIGMTLANTNAAGTTAFEYQGTGQTFQTGVGNASTGTSALRNAWFLYNATSGNTNIVVGSNGNIGLGVYSTVSGCPTTSTVLICGVLGVANNGYIFQDPGNLSSTNYYLETNEQVLASTTQLNPGLLVVGTQNSNNVGGQDYGYNSTSSRYRTRIFESALGDISFSFHAGNTAPTAQSSFTDAVIIRGDTQQLQYATTLKQNLLYSGAGTVLPTCNSGANGTKAVVSDATTPTYLGTYTSGGAVESPVLCNGADWVTY